jgi:hypothetical protein
LCGANMMLFLKLKHWQVFLFAFGIPVIIQVIFLLLINQHNTNFIVHKVIPVITLISNLIYWCWIWSIVSRLKDKIPDEVELNPDFFNLFFILSLVFSFFFAGFNMIFLGNPGKGYFHPGIGFLLYLLPLYLFSIFCNCYCIYFASKILKVAQLQKYAKFYDFAGDFFLLLFYPLGVWFIQPKIINVFKDEELIPD